MCVRVVSGWLGQGDARSGAQLTPTKRGGTRGGARHTADGWGYDTMAHVPSTSFKGQVVGMLHACTYARMPLIVLNSLVILVKLVFG